MTKDIEIKEIVPIDLEGGTLVNGFPSSGITSAIATESLINTSNFELQANIDSDKFHTNKCHKKWYAKLCN